MNITTNTTKTLAYTSCSAVLARLSLETTDNTLISLAVLYAIVFAVMAANVNWAGICDWFKPDNYLNIGKK